MFNLDSKQHMHITEFVRVNERDSVTLMNICKLYHLRV